jgi:adenylate cyclase
MTRRAWRLGSGLVLFTYVALHLCNHALGLVSLALAERGLDAALRLWQSLPGSRVLYGAALVHLGLAFDAIYWRRSLRPVSIDMLRVVLGLGIPLLLIGHAVTTRVAWELYAQSPHYARVVWSLRVTGGQGRQLALLVPGWLHGCLGLHLAFAGRPRYRRLRPLWFAVALLLPVLGALGFFAMGRELAADTAMRGHLDAALALPSGGVATLSGVHDVLLAAYLAAVAAAFVACACRSSSAGARSAARAWPEAARVLFPQFPQGTDRRAGIAAPESPARSNGMADEAHEHLTTARRSVPRSNRPSSKDST